MADQKTTAPTPLKGWLPLGLTFALWLVTAAAWWLLEQNEQANLRTKLDAQARYLASHVAADLNSRVPSLQRIAKRWELRGGTPKEEFLGDAAAYFEDAPGYQALVWVDSDLFVRWRVPRRSDDLAQRLNLAFEANRREAQERAKTTRAPAMTAPIDLVTGGKGFQIYCPLYVQGEFQGFVLAVFRIEGWLNHVFRIDRHPRGAEGFRVAVSMDGVPFYRQAGWDDLPAAGLNALDTAEVLGHRFSVVLRPTPNFLRNNGTMLPELIAVAGGLLAVLVGLLAHFHQRATAEARLALTAQRELEAEIVEHEKTGQQLQQERERLAYILDGTNVGTWEWNVQSGEIVCNERWAEIVGYTLAELQPTTIETWTRLTHPDDLAVSGALLKKHFNGELPYYECEARLRHRNGEWIWVLDRGKVATWSADGTPLLMSGTRQDITDRKRAEEQIRHMATHDALTRLPTLPLAQDRLVMAMNMARRHRNLAALLFVDLDGFKEVNDTFGHEAGDAVLREVAQRLLGCARATDTVARLGGDEFLFIATGLGAPNDAAEIAEKILQALSRSIMVADQEAAIGASIGIALFPGDGEEPDQLIRAADIAMYRVKNAGKNGFAFAGGKREEAGGVNPGPE